MSLKKNLYKIIVIKMINIKTIRLFLKYRGYVGIHSSGFRDFLLKPELLRSIVDSGFEHPSEGKLIDKICPDVYIFTFLVITFHLHLVFLYHFK